MEQKSKTAKESFVGMTELVLPNDTNTFGNLMGGRLMYWMDIAAALAAMKHCSAPVVTASVDNLSFHVPILLGNVVHIEAKVSRAFSTSMEVHINVWGENPLQQKKYKKYLKKRKKLLNKYFCSFRLTSSRNRGECIRS